MLTKLIMIAAAVSYTHLDVYKRQDVEVSKEMIWQKVKGRYQSIYDWFVGNEGQETVSYTHLDVYKRQFMFCFEQDGKLWFCTNNTKEVYKDMQENPEVEVSVFSPEYAWIRLRGKAVFENNMSVKEGCMNNPIVKGQYQTADNPIFEVFYLENPHGVIADFSGNPPYEF